MIPYPYSYLPVVREDERHWWFHCCFHKGDNEPSMVVNKTEPFKLFYRCWACGENGSAKSFAVKYLGHDPKLIDGNIVDVGEIMKVIRPKINWESLRGTPLEHLPAEEQRLADAVGVSVETIRKFGIGWKDYKFLIPMYDEEGICGIATRFYSRAGLDGWVCAKRCIKGSKHGWFWPEKDGDVPLFITEGWSDCAVMTELGFPSIGRFNAGHLDLDISLIAGPENIYIVSDTDEAGLKGSEKLQKLIGGKIIRPQTTKGVTQYYYKDIREMYLKEGKAATKEWLQKQL